MKLSYLYELATWIVSCILFIQIVIAIWVVRSFAKTARKNTQKIPEPQPLPRPFTVYWDCCSLLPLVCLGKGLRNANT